MANLDFSQILIGFAVLVFSLSVHEAAHAWSADRLGDKTARLLGRVSLNPAVHVDMIGTIVFPLVSMTTGLPLIGWAKPVPVDTRQLRGNWREKFMLIAAAGPASNLIIAAVAALIFHLVASASPLVAQILFVLIQLNVLLAVFNMIPVPPLDGGNVLAGLLPGKFADVFDRVLRPYGFLILYGLMLSGALWTVVGPIQNAVLGLLL